MLGFLRLLIVGSIALTVLYWLLSLYLRSTTRERLEEEWVEEGSIGEQEAYVEKGMDEYQRSFRRKLLLLVYIVPMVAFAAILYATNFM